MDALVNTIGFCALCRQPLDLTKPHAIVKSDYAHLSCADEYDSHEWGQEFKQEARV